MADPATYGFRKSYATQINQSHVATETFAGLGTTIDGKTLPTGLLVAPQVIIENPGNRSLYAKNKTVTGFDIYGRDTGDDPPYNDVQILVYVFQSAAGVEVDDLLKDIIFRMGPKMFMLYGEKFILRRMNDAYKRVNQNYQLCRKTFVADWSQYTTATLKDYVVIPKDWVKPYLMNPVKHYRHPTVFRKDEANTYSIDYVGDERRLSLNGVTTTSKITFSYYSAGLKLVNNANPTGTETNKAEWPDEIKQLLYFETLAGLNVSLSNEEIQDRMRLRKRAQGLRVSAYTQATGPNVGGEDNRETVIDDPYTRTS